MGQAIELTDRVKEICREIVSNHVPEEVPFFESIWVSFWGSMKCVTVEQISESVSWRLTDEPIRYLGAIGGQHDQTVDTFYAIGTLCITTARLIQNTSPSDFDVSVIEDTMVAVSASIGTPQYLSSAIVKDAASLLRNIISTSPEDLARQVGRRSTEHGPKSQVARAGVDGADYVYVDRLTASLKYKKGHRCKLRGARSIPKRGDYAIVVNEPDNCLTIKKGRKSIEYEISDLMLSQRIWLYLSMKNVGGSFTLADIAALRRSDKGIEPKTLYHYRASLSQSRKGKPSLVILNDLLPEAKEETYYPPKQGWSFCWIRIPKTYEQSVLLKGSRRLSSNQEYGPESAKRDDRNL